jgi:hypothetical protein
VRPGLPVTITVPANVTLNSGANSMTASLVSSAASLTPQRGHPGTGTFDVAGTLNVGATPGGRRLQRQLHGHRRLFLIRLGGPPAGGTGRKGPFRSR